MDGIRTEQIHPLLPDHVTEQYTQHRKVTSGRDGIFTSADVVIALELADATLRFARCTHDHASGGWDSAADVNHDSRIILSGRSRDPAGSDWRDRFVTEA